MPGGRVVFLLQGSGSGEGACCGDDCPRSAAYALDVELSLGPRCDERRKECYNSKRTRSTATFHQGKLQDKAERVNEIRARSPRPQSLSTTISAYARYSCSAC